MPKLLDEILVIDVEATCWPGNPPEGQESEIIEIGLCRLDAATAEVRETRGILVRPERSTVSAFCTELTTLTQEQVEEGIPFRDACALLRDEYKAPNRAWASYGDYDRSQFERQCRSFSVPYPFGKTHLNVKTLFALSQGLSREVGMAGALKQVGLPLIGTHHRGVDDAANIARLLTFLLLRPHRSK